MVVALNGAEHALREVKKMDAVLDGEEWPNAMAALQKNLLETSKLDEDCESWAGNERALLPILRSRYLEVGGVQASTKVSFFETGARPPVQQPPNTEKEKQAAAPDQVNQKNSPTDEPPKQPQASPASAAKQSDQAEAAERNQGPPTNPTKKAEPDPDQLLSSVGLRVFSGRWQDVRAAHSFFDEMAGTVDMVLTDILGDLPRGRSSPGAKPSWDFIENDEIEKLIQMSRSMLKPGAYIVLFHGIDQLHVIKSLLEASKFAVAPYPVIVAKEQSSLQKTTAVLFPQHAYEIFTVASKDPGGSQREFYPKLNDATHPYTSLRTPSKRKFNVIADVPTRTRKLCRVGEKKLIRNTEKPVALLRELLDMYCPEDGLVLDPYAGTYTTGLACLDTSRRSVLMEADPQCADLAKKRLVLATKTRITREERRSRMMLVDESTQGSTADAQTTDDFDEISHDGHTDNEESNQAGEETRKASTETKENEACRDDEGLSSPPKTRPSAEKGNICFGTGRLTPPPSRKFGCQHPMCRLPGIPLEDKPVFCNRCKMRMHSLCAYQRPLSSTNDNGLIKYCSEDCWALADSPTPKRGGSRKPRLLSPPARGRCHATRS